MSTGNFSITLRGHKLTKEQFYAIHDTLVKGINENIGWKKNEQQCVDLLKELGMPIPSTPAVSSKEGAREGYQNT